MDSITMWVVTRARDLVATFTDRDAMREFLLRQPNLKHTWVQEIKSNGAGLPEAMWHASRYAA